MIIESEKKMSKVFFVRVSPEVHRALKVEAAKAGLTLNQVIAGLIQKFRGGS